jgi:hypothetical protein
VTMHILPAYYTTTDSKRKQSTKVQKPTEHDKWLKSMGLSLDQIAAKKTVDKNWKKEYTKVLKVDSRDYESSGLSGNASSCAKRDLMSNLHKEPKHVRDAILDKASRVMPLFNKGGLQYATPATDMTMVGSQSRRG